ncbi:hypothetical protein [Alkalihalobacillus trypoxylicola]|uniref:Pore-forming protein n=1 Tax=Alkalihalobacillus trypoxylicola TaxID=519424 RepID=A0A161PIK5_9BACI|nr:hypothetical protein [Alkalihalobacillus trypoxylicola]KYG33514.1 hypothetical protein AZF04_16260 [Alkalihalobacillus trypoxylicola]
MQDHYITREPKFLWILLFIVTLPYAYISESNFRYIAFVLLFVYVFAMMIEYHLVVEERTISVKIKFLRFKLLEKAANVDEIGSIQFVDIGTRHVIFIKKKQGGQIRIHRFKPEHFSGRIRQFAQLHELKIESVGTNRS